MPPEKQERFIAADYCGWNQRYGRYTVCPTGETLVCRPSMLQVEWEKAQLEFLEKYPGLNVHYCPARYSTDGELIGTTDEICARLRARLEKRPNQEDRDGEKEKG